MGASRGSHQRREDFCRNPVAAHPDRGEIPAISEVRSCHRARRHRLDPISRPSDVVAAQASNGQNGRMDLARAGWLATVLIFLIAVLILVVQGYYGYAGVTLAVAVAAAINLF